MGATNLNAALAQAGRKLELRAFLRDRLGILADASSLLHKLKYTNGVARAVANSPPDHEPILKLFRSKLLVMKPSCRGHRWSMVFDGYRLAAKQVDASRAKLGNKAKLAIKEALDGGASMDSVSASDCEATFSITDELTLAAINMCHKEGFQYLPAPCEADQQIASLLSGGQKFDTCWCYDSDYFVLVAGAVSPDLCPQVAIIQDKTSFRGTTVVFNLGDIAAGRVRTSGDSQARRRAEAPCT